MKEISIIIDSQDLSKVTDILQEHKVGITFFDIQGTGRTPKHQPEYVQSYQTGRSTVPRFIGKTLLISIVSDNYADIVINNIISVFNKTEPQGIIFVKDVINAFELGTGLKDEEILVSN